ncbi:hypothetical protein SynWH8103_00119 [Synechococcus sp. WH 8103]|nr:hypothetical protein SynWH8103_00119 [Synechococcus sp. WH 8103]
MKRGSDRALEIEPCDRLQRIHFTHPLTMTLQQKTLTPSPPREALNTI